MAIRFSLVKRSDEKEEVDINNHLIVLLMIYLYEPLADLEVTIRRLLAETEKNEN